jgi:hypothetical protein
MCDYLKPLNDSLTPRQAGPIDVSIEVNKNKLLQRSENTCHTKFGSEGCDYNTVGSMNTDP